MFPKSTPEILALKVLGETTSEMWVAWSVEMLMAGFDGEHLVQLAGMNPPFNIWEMDVLVPKVLAEQDIDYSDKERVIKDYVCYLVNKALTGEMPTWEALEKLKNLYYYGDVPDEEVEEFMGLYYSKEDLDEWEQSPGWQWPKWWPWKRKKIDMDAIILEAFKKRQLQCRQGLTTPVVKPS
jgi:hypothetical protein